MTTLAPEIPLKELAARWYELTVQNAPKLDTMLLLDIATYCSGDPWADNPSIQAMGIILQNEPELKELLDERLGYSYRAVCSALLLIWSLSTNQHKATPNAPSAKYTIDHWNDASMLWDEGAPDNVRVKALLDFTLPLADRMPLEERATVFESIYKKVMPHLPMLARNSVDDATALQRSELYVALGHCALAAVALDARGAQWHETAWLNDIRELCVGNQANRALVATTMAQSDLPDAYKLRAFKGLDSNLWSIPIIQQEMMRLLPEQEHRRLPLLAWQGVRAYNLPPEVVQTIALANQTITKAFCPTIYPLLEFSSSPENWGVQQTMTELAEQFYMANHLRLEAIALPEDSFSP